MTQERRPNGYWLQRATQRAGGNLEAYLKREYCELEKTSFVISQELDVPHGRLYTWLVRFRIPRRAPGRKGKVKLPSKTELETLYCREERTIEQIASHFDVSLSTIYRRMLKFRIERRPSASVSSFLKAKRPSKSELIDLYVSQRESVESVARELHTTPQIVRSMLKSFGVSMRHSKYEDWSFRKKCADEILRIKNKSPLELTTSDFLTPKDSAEVSYRGLISWYERTNFCKPIVALNILLNDIYGIRKDQEKQQLEDLLQRYVDGK